MRFTPRRIILQIIYLSLILTVGCTTYRPISLDILIPPDTLIYPGLTSATIVTQNQLIGVKDSLFHANPDSLVLDSTFRGELIAECTLGFGELIETSPGIEQVIIDSTDIPPTFNPGVYQNQFLQKKFVEEICSQSGTDIVIMLEGIYAWDTLVSILVFDPNFQEEDGIH